MSTGITCTLLVDGVAAPDGSAPDDVFGPVVLENLAITWGRSDTMTQPEAESCSFEIMDDGGFVSTLRTGSRIDVLASGDIPDSEPVSTFSNGDFELAAITWTTSNGATEKTALRFYSGAAALRFAPTDTGAPGSVVLAPSTFEAPGTNPDAWDDIPTTSLGQLWPVSLAVWVPVGATVEILPVLFTGPYADAWTSAPVAPIVVQGNNTWQSVSFGYLVEQQTPYWVGIELSVFPSGPAWNDVAPALTWDAVDPSLMWNDYGSVYVDEVQVTSPSTATGNSVLVFSGRVTELSSQWDDAADAPVLSVTASGFTADLENRRVGDEPWPVEDVDTRAHRILDAAGLPITIDIDTSLEDTLLSWRDVDSQGALGLLQSAAVSVDGVLWPAVHSALGAYLRLEDPSMRVSLLQLAQLDGPPPQIVHTNLALNPDAEAFGAVATLRTNVVPDPAMTTGTWIVGTGHMTAQTAASDNPFTGTTFRRLTANAPTDGSDGFDTSGFTVPVGPVAVSVWLRTSHATSWRVSAIHAASTGFVYTSQPEIFTGPGGWTRAYFTGTVATAGILGIRVRRFTTGSASMPSGSTLDIGGALMEAATTALLPYFNGATPAAEDFTYSWSGAANNSTSVQRAPATAGVSPYNGTLAARWSSVTEHDVGARSFACMPLVSGQQVGFIWTFAPLVAQAGQWVTGVIRFKAPAGLALNFTTRTSVGGASVGTSVVGNGDWQEARVSGIVATDGVLIGIQFITRAPYQPGVPFYVDRVVLAVESATYTGPYFDGRTPDTDEYVYAWTGAVDASTSTQTTVQTHTIVITQIDPDAGINISACDVLRDPVTWIQSVADVVTRVSATWKLQGTDEEGNPTTTDITETVIDAPLEERHGTRAASVSTELQASADAQDVAGRILARTNPDAWRASGITLDDDDLSAAEEYVRLMLTLLDGTARIGLAIVIDDLPSWSPSGNNAGVYLEGGTYSFIGGRWVLEMVVSSGQGGLGESAQWDELDPSWTWDMWEPSLTWNDLRGVSAP